MAVDCERLQMEMIGRRRTPSRRRWLRYSLWTLFVLVLLASIALAWLAAKVKEARQQAAAVDWIRHMRGTVFYDYQIYEQNGAWGSVKLYDSRKQPSDYETLRRILGDDFFDRVVEIYFGSDVYFDGPVLNVGKWPSEITDGDLERLSNLLLPHVEKIGLIDPQITDAGLVHLAQCKGLRRIVLENAHVSTEGLQRLQAALLDCEIICNPPPPGLPAP